MPQTYFPRRSPGRKASRLPHCPTARCRRFAGLHCGRRDARRSMRGLASRESDMQDVSMKRKPSEIRTVIAAHVRTGETFEFSFDAVRLIDRRRVRAKAQAVFGPGFCDLQ